MVAEEGVDRLVLQVGAFVRVCVCVCASVSADLDLLWVGYKSTLFVRMPVCVYVCRSRTMTSTCAYESTLWVRRWTTLPLKLRKGQTSSCLQ